MQLKVEANKLYNSIIQNLEMSLRKVWKFENILDFLIKWRLELWEIGFFQEFRQKGGI
jgi:hypothetical protein